MSMIEYHRYANPITDLIKERHSIRTYKAHPLSDEHRNQLTKFIGELQINADIRVRFKLVDSNIARHETGARLGTYGVVKGASTYVVSAVQKNTLNIESFGYCFEQLILFATSLGLGTCWMAMTMKKNEFAKAIELSKDEFLPIITPIGYPQRSLNLTDTFFRATARSNTRKSWPDIFFNDDFSRPLTQSEAGIYAAALEMTRLAPSASNHQPWRIVKENDTFHFYLQRTKGYRDKYEYDIQRLDIGIAMCHFDLTLQEQGVRGTWHDQEPNLNIHGTEMVYINSWVKNKA